MEWNREAIMKIINLFFVIVGVAGCTTTAIPDFAASHPANPHAVEAPVTTFMIKDAAEESITSQTSDTKSNRHSHSMPMGDNSNGDMNSQHEGEHK